MGDETRLKCEPIFSLLGDRLKITTLIKQDLT